MAPKGKGPSVKHEDLQQEDILQAVVFADSFNSNFAPVSDDRPRVLFPVANSALLDYTLEFLCSGGVQEIFVVCCRYADQVKEHLKKSRWTEKSTPCRVVPIVSDGCICMGDALRDIDAKNLIQSDFILIYGDVVSNIKLKNIVEEHKERRQKDKSAIMTMVFTQVPPGHATRQPEDDVILAVNNKTQNVIHYQKTSANKDAKKFEFPVEILLDHDDVQIRNDLLDANISICSPQVPQLFTDNFDYETRDSFVKGILINEEIMGNTIQMHVVSDAYAARISDFKMYDAVSQDILNRWTFPFVPDNCYRHNPDQISFSRHNIYLSQEVSLARDSSVVENVLLGSGSSVGSNTVISHSIIGRNCKIGQNVKVHGSYIWDNVVIDDNCTIETSFLCDNVKVYKNVNLKTGCILASKVEVGPDIICESGTIAVSSLSDDDFGDDQLDSTDGDMSHTSEMFGTRGKAYNYADREKDDSDDEEIVRKVWGLTIESESSDDADTDSHADSESPPPSLPPDDRERDESDDEEIVRKVWGLTIESESSDDADTDSHADSESPPPSLPPDVPVYYTEMLDTIQRAKDDNINNENLILEINSLKHAYNISIKELTRIVVRALLEQPISEDPSLAGAQALAVLQAQLKKRMEILKNYIKNEESQLQCLRALQDFGCASSNNMSILMKIIHGLYDEDLLEEQVIIKWYKLPADMSAVESDEEEDEENKHKEVRKKVAPLVEWLEEADEETSDED